MAIKKATFITSLAAYAPYQGMGLPEIAIAGRSNVGKSSMINSVCGRQALAKVSGTPGKTRLLNIFNIDDQFHLVDLPGYGFARVSKEEQKRWSHMMEGYFASSELLCHVLHLVDLRHDPTRDDISMSEFLRATGMPFSIIATKADKISKARRAQHVHAICRALQVQPWEVIPYSAQDGTGKEATLALFLKICEAQTSEVAEEDSSSACTSPSPSA